VTNELQQTRYDRLLRRVGGIIGPGSKVSEVLTELFPTIDVENVPSELLILAGTNTAFGGGTIVGAAGEAPKMGLFNPADSNTIITLTDVFITESSANNVFRWALNVNQLATNLGTQTFRDTRRPIVERPVGLVTSESSATFAGATGQMRVTQNQELHLFPANDICNLRPGIGFEIGNSILTSTIWCTFYWRERPMEASEILSSG